VPVRQLLREIRERGYPGSSNLLVRYINQGRPGTERPHIAPRKATQILLTNPENLPGDQRETAGRLSAACPEMKALARLTGKFAAMPGPDPANEGRLPEWIADARAADLPHLHSLTRGLEPGIKAATAAVTLPHHNGRTEGVSNIKDENAETADVRARRLRTPPSPDPSRVRRRSVTTESATEPLS
jgi:transposase